LNDRLSILRAFLRRGFHRLRAILVAPGRLAGALRARAPERLLIAPQDIRTSDPTIAAEIGAGYFAFGGKIVNAMSRSPFAVDPGGPAYEAETDDRDPTQSAWLRQLAGFGWLRHLRAADNLAARSRGRALVADFLALHPRPSRSVVWEPSVTARRLLAWLSQSPVILDGADRDFYLAFMRALDTHRLCLEGQLHGGLRGNDRLLAALALAELGLCTRADLSSQPRRSQALEQEIAVQVLPDGGHISRNPQALIDLLLDLLPLRQAFAARGIPAPATMLNAIDRMMPMVRLFRHGDGSLGLFNGMSLTAPELVATILAYDEAQGEPMLNAPRSGYQRVQAGQTVLLVDAGRPPPPEFSVQAHAGCLSFELSVGYQRLVINCGTPEGGRPSAIEAARTTAAHSTLVVDDTSSCRFAAGSGLKRWLGDEILAGPTRVDVARGEEEGATRLVLSHDGYVARFGLVHHRELSLEDDGRRLTGCDRVTDTGPRVAPWPYALRFHLHPAIRPQAAADDLQVRLALPDGTIWLFEADAPLVLEPSILFAAPGGPRRTHQIKIAANSGTRQLINWRFFALG
jgi:uncharacterized heparinase superfamily protein